LRIARDVVGLSYEGGGWTKNRRKEESSRRGSEVESRKMKRRHVK
jgi:hypothetical protein